MPIAQIVGNRGRVLAFEPQRLVFQMLCANIALNELSTVDARQTGLGSAPGHAQVPVTLPDRDFNFGGVSLSREDSGETVAVETIDGLNVPRCRLIKVDVEGMEQEVLLGAAETIVRCRPVLYVENDRRKNSRALLALIMSWRYRIWWDFPHLYDPQNFAGASEDPFAEMRSRNVLCLPEEKPLVGQGDPIASPDEWPG